MSTIEGDSGSTIGESSFSTGNSSSPVSGTGTLGDPFTLGAHSVTPSELDAPTNEKLDRVDANAATTKIVPDAGGDVQIGADGLLDPAADSGFLVIPMTDDDPSGAPTLDAGHAGVVFNKTTGVLWLYVPGVGWTGSAAFTPAP